MNSSARLLVSGAIFAMAGCSDPTPPPEPAAEDCATPGDEEGNGLADCQDPACASEPACAPQPPRFAPLHVQTVQEGAPDLLLGPAPTVIDTTALTIGGLPNSSFVQENGYAILFARMFDVQGPVTVAGTRPLIVVAHGQVTISALLDVSGAARKPGPGAATAGPGVGAAGTTFLGPSTRASSGGGGGSFGTLGGRGGSNAVGTIPPGAAGAAYGALIGDLLVGGSAGGNGGFSTGSGVGVGGAGGGALQISSAVSISLMSGTLKAVGGGGASGGVGFVGGGGGGSGGQILLEAPTLNLRGGLYAGGGGGGGGGSGAGGTMSSTDGEDGKAAAAVALGGIGQPPQGSNGGDGAALVGSALVEAQPGAAPNSKGGGGGGGAGRIWLRYRAATPPDLSLATISPLPSVDATLP